MEFIGISGISSSFNLFSYCRNNSINSTDPWGTNGVSIVSGVSQLYKRLSAIVLLIATLAVISGSLAGITGVSGGTALPVALTVGVVSALSAYGVLHYDAKVKAVLAFINSASTATPPLPPDQGGKGTRTTSKTLYNNKDKGYHIDVENSGYRTGQIHLQMDEKKYIYNVQKQCFQTEKGVLAPNSVQKLLEEPKVIRAIAKGLRYLGY